MFFNNSRFSSATSWLREKPLYAIALLVLISSSIVNSAVAYAQAVRAGFPQLNGGQTPLWTISEAKLDRKYGIEVRPIYIPGGARLTQTVVSNDVDIALTGGAVINAILGGADLVFVGGAVPTYAFSLYARSDGKAVPDLREKSSASSPKALHRTTPPSLLKQYKMTQRDMKVLYFSRQQDALAALDKGIVSAAVLSAPTTLMARRL